MDLYDTIRQRERAIAQLNAELRQARQTEDMRQQAAEAERQRSPADRLLPGRETQIQRAREAVPEPTAPVNEPEDKPKVAEQMKLRPVGLQRAPSPGGPGVTYINPRILQPLDQTAARKETLFEQASRKREENRASNPDQQLANERHQQAQRDLDRFLELPRR